MSPETEKLLEGAAWVEGLTAYHPEDGTFVPDAGSWQPWPEVVRQAQETIAELATALRAAEERAEANATDAKRWREARRRMVEQNFDGDGHVLIVDLEADGFDDEHEDAAMDRLIDRASAQEVDRG